MFILLFFKLCCNIAKKILQNRSKEKNSWKKWRGRNKGQRRIYKVRIKEMEVSGVGRDTGLWKRFCPDRSSWQNEEWGLTKCSGKGKPTTRNKSFLVEEETRDVERAPPFGEDSRLERKPLERRLRATVWEAWSRASSFHTSKMLPLPTCWVASVPSALCSPLSWTGDQRGVSLPLSSWMMSFGLENKIPVHKERKSGGIQWKTPGKNGRRFKGWQKGLLKGELLAVGGLSNGRRL